MKNFREQCFEIFRQTGIKGNYAELFRKIEEQYEKTKRDYHTFRGHIAYCLNELETVKHLVKKLAAAGLALITHDSVMDFLAKDNEEKSAEFAVQLCWEENLSEEFADDVSHFVLATKLNAVLGDEDARIVRDIDYSILGQDEKTFAEYESNIRKEYSMFSDEDYRKGRSDFLKGVLAKPIFLTAHFRKKYELRARRNLEQLIKKMSA